MLYFNKCSNYPICHQASQQAAYPVYHSNTSSPLVKPTLDPLQFAYQPHVGVDDAVIYLLQRAHSHLDGGGDTVRIMFFDFSSAFNSIQPHLLSEKLLRMDVSSSAVSWVADYFQYHSESCHLQRFSDDSAVVGCISSGQESEYRQLVDNFVDRCNQNHLLLNVNKTKEMVVDFRRTTVSTRPLKIMGEEVEVVEDYKYLGVHLNNRLDWRTNTNAVYKKGMSRLYFLRKLRSFNVCSKMLEIFYQSVMASAIYFAVVCWGSSISARDASRINKLIRKAGSVMGLKLETFESVMSRRSLNKLLSIMDNPDHPLHNTVQGQRSSFSNRLIQFRCHKERFKKSFLPFTIKLFNDSPLSHR